jgi:predicted dehydrogenase
MEKIKIGLVGLGGIAQVIHIPILKKFGNAEIAAVCDIEKSKAKFVAERSNIKSYYSDLGEMLRRHEDIAAIDICTPTHTHREVALASLEAGKDILVERPIARHYVEAEDVVRCAKERKRKLMVGMNNRFRPDAMILKSFVEGGELGDIFYVKAGWLQKQSNNKKWRTQKEKSGGGVFIDHGIVMLDLALWLMGFPEPSGVMASMYSHETKSVEDSSAVFVRMKNGATLALEVSWTMVLDKDFLYCNLFGTKGSALINPLRIHKQMHGSLVNVTPTKMERSVNLYKRSYEYELKHFVGAVLGLNPIISTGDEALHRMKLVEAIYKAAEKGSEIEFR